MERKRSLYLKIAIIVLLIVATNTLLPHNALQSFGYRIIAKPMAFLENKLQSKKIASLENERDKLIGNVVMAEALERENDALRRQLNIESRTMSSLISAKIFLLQRNTFISTVMIDKGSADGLASGMIVIAPGNILMGKIGETFDHASRVILADDPRSVISVRILETSILAESKGSFRGEAAINLIARTETLESGSTVVTSGLDSFPVGLAVGTITNVDPGANSLFKNARAALLFDPAESPMIFILKP